MKEYNQEETIKKIREYILINYEPIKPRKKVFYGLKYMQGWRFYFKALVNLDFRSIIWYIKSKYI